MTITSRVSGLAVTLLGTLLLVTASTARAQTAGPDARRPGSQTSGSHEVEFSVAPVYMPSRALGNLAWGEPIQELPGLSAVVSAPMALGTAGGVAPTITLHRRHNLSHEIFYSYARTALAISSGLGQVFILGPDGGLIDQEPSSDQTRYTSDLTMRQAGYNLLVHIGSRNRRLVPYLSIGSSVTAFEFRDNPRPPAGLFRVALRDVGGILVAIGAGRVSPLDGGTVYRIALTYGAGTRIRLTRMIGLRLDARETVMRDPDFFNRQSVVLNAGGIFTGQIIGTYRRRQFAAGLTVGF